LNNSPAKTGLVLKLSGSIKGRAGKKKGHERQRTKKTEKKKHRGQAGERSGEEQTQTEKENQRKKKQGTHRRR
jgi:hypothetical protein